MDTKRIGVLAIICASVLWAVEPVLTKLAYRNADFLETSTIRAIFVALAALPYAIITGRRSGLGVSRRQLPKLLYLGIAGTIVADLAYYFSLTRIPVINAVLIGHMQPIFIVILGFALLKEDKLTVSDYLGIVIMVVAGLLVTTKTMANLTALRLGTSGDLFVLLATFAWATTAIVMRKYLRDMNAGALVFYRFSIGAVVFAVYLLAKSSFRISNVYQVVVGILVGVGSILYYESLKRIKAAQVSALELSTPFFAAFLGLVVLKESVTIMQVLGIGLLFAGVHFLSKKEEAYF